MLEKAPKVGDMKLLKWLERTSSQEPEESKVSITCRLK